MHVDAPQQQQLPPAPANPEQMYYAGIQRTEELQAQLVAAIEAANEQRREATHAATAAREAATAAAQQTAAATAQNAAATDAARQAAASAAARNDASAAAKLPNPAKPPDYDGSRRSGSVRTWAFQVRQYLRVARVDETHWVQWAATQLRGNAAIWWENRCNQHGDAPLAWAAFTQELAAEFEPLDRSRSARDRLAAVKQRNSVANFNAEFRSIILEIPDCAPAEQLDRYLRALKPKLAFELEKQPPATLLEAMRIAERLDSTWFAASKRFTGNSNSYSQSLFSRQGDSGPTPMELGAVASASSNRRSSPPTGYADSSRRRAPLTESERSHLMANEGCLYCRKDHAGHYARNCPLKRRSSPHQQGNGRPR